MTGRRGHVPARTLLGVLVLLGTVAPARGAVSVRAEVVPRSIPEDRTVELRLVVEGDGVGDLPPPRLAETKDWSLVSGPSVASQFRFVNGVSSSSRTFSWVLAPAGPGERPIPPLQIELEGQVHTTEPLTVTVRPAAGRAGGRSSGEATPGAGEGEDEVFVRAELEPESPYVGQRTLLRYKLFTRVEVNNIPQLQEVPSYPGFWSEELESPERISPRRETVDGVEYQVYTIRTLALFPTASGPTTLPPVTFSIPVRSRDPAGLQRSFFFSSIRPVSRRTLPLTVNVRPLPAAGRPAGFSNAVGRFDMQVEADRRRARAGEAIGITVTVEGAGNLRSADAPAMAPATDFTVYPPHPRELVTVAAGRVARSWEYILVPHLPGEQAVPSLSFSYFDPDAGAFRTLTAPEIRVEISGPAMAQGEAGGPDRQAIRRLGRDIHFLKPAAGGLAPVSPSPYRRGWFWAGLVLPPLLNLAALLGRWQRRRAQHRRPLARRRRARRSALRRLRRAAAAQEGQAFHREVARALSEFVADKFGGQATGLTYDRIAALLAVRSVPEETSRAFLKVLEECDVARFAPGAGGGGARAELIRRARQSLDDLEAAL